MCKKRKINLIEILVVTAVIAVLVSIGISQIQSMVQRAKITKAMSEIESISAAIVNYKSEYGELPYIGETYPSQDMALSFSEILPILRGDNLRGINFLNEELSSDFQTGSSKAYTHYSYMIALDYDHSDTIDANIFSNISYPEIIEDLLASSSVWMKSPNPGHSDLYSWVSLDLNNPTGLLADNGLPSGDDMTTEENYPDANTDLRKDNKGHGNNEDGVDSDNKNWEKKAEKENNVSDNQADADAGTDDERLNGNNK